MVNRGPVEMPPIVCTKCFMYVADARPPANDVAGASTTSALLGPAHEKEHQHDDAGERGPRDRRAYASSDVRQLEKRHRQREHHDVADELEHALERQRREDLGALHVRRARDEHDARRLAAVRDENVVQARAGERRLDRHPERRRADRPKKNPPANALERERQQVHDRGEQRASSRFASVMLSHVVVPVDLAREQHERRDDRGAQNESKDS